MTSIIGLIINLLENSHNIIEQIIAVIIGFSWALCSYFVLPILVLGNVGPVTALKQISTINLTQNPELAAEDLRIAATEIGKITNIIDVEEILDDIFSNFCIGK